MTRRAGSVALVLVASALAAAVWWTGARRQGNEGPGPAGAAAPVPAAIPGAGAQTGRRSTATDDGANAPGRSTLPVPPDAAGAVLAQVSEAGRRAAPAAPHAQAASVAARALQAAPPPPAAQAEGARIRVAGRVLSVETGADGLVVLGMAAGEGEPALRLVLAPGGAAASPDRLPGQMATLDCLPHGRIMGVPVMVDCR
ncbi:hypothetical protein DEH84_01405 [Aquabacterium olei]|uniref:Uncharacterized protein n=1 Tax=Aquabacterium olei TaxID=1296669 RepID=A0A2U8FMP4_9BURK|nr:hypothetical protein [Aquabacterium olei]AWI52240.1 hypothetical protein DEH84_01405 [Aquabacterium olei]